MPVEIHTYTLGPLENNTYLLVDSATRQAAIIDPSFDVQRLLPILQENGWQLAQVWLTHAHFDHIAGVKLLCAAFPGLPVALHPADLDLWRNGGGAPIFGIQMDTGPEPSLPLAHAQMLALGESQVEVRHTPGHTRGHVVFYCAAAQTLFSGDLLFKHSVGRTDLPGGDENQLLQSIYTQVLTLPVETRLLSGHGPASTLQAEVEENPYIR